MIAAAFKGGRDVLEEFAVFVGDGAGLAVFGRVGFDGAAAIGLADRLVAETYAQDGRGCAAGFDEVDADTSVLWCAGAGGEDNTVGVEGFDVFY